jgi:hypothetical protein
MIRYSLFAILAALLLACAAGTRMSARVNPAFDNHCYKKIYIRSSFSNLELQTALEEKLQASFGGHGVECVFESWVEFSYDVRDPDEFIRLIDSSGCDAVLAIVPAGSGHSQTYIPKTSSSSTTGSGRVDGYGNIYYKEKTRTSEFGGYNINKPWANFEAMLYDAATFEVAWKASAQTGGNAFANWKTVVRSMAGQTVSKLVEQGLVRR